MNNNDSSPLPFGFSVDRDYMMPFSKIVAYVYGGFSVFLLHPLVFYMLVRHSKFMNNDYRIGCMILQVSQIMSDFWMCFGYQLYPLCPYAGFLCNGFLCQYLSGRFMLTVMAFLVINICAAYILLIFRTQQLMLAHTESRWKVPRKLEICLGIVLYLILFANVISFGLFATDAPDKEQIIEKEDLQWTGAYIQLQLFGARFEPNAFNNAMIILAASVLCIFPTIPVMAAQVIWELSNQKKQGQTQSQARIGKAAINLFLRCASSGLFFCLPLGFLFSGMLGILELFPVAPMPYLRIVGLTMFYIHSLPCTGAFLLMNTQYMIIIRNSFVCVRGKLKRKSLVGVSFTSFTEKI